MQTAWDSLIKKLSHAGVNLRFYTQIMICIFVDWNIFMSQIVYMPKQWLILRNKIFINAEAQRLRNPNENPLINTRSGVSCCGKSIPTLNLFCSPKCVLLTCFGVGTGVTEIYFLLRDASAAIGFLHSTIKNDLQREAGYASHIKQHSHRCCTTKSVYIKLARQSPFGLISHVHKRTRRALGRLTTFSLSLSLS